MPGLGPSRCLSNRYIRKMLRFSGAGRKDVFYDVGCGAGQLCVIAASEFHVKRAIGIDYHKARVRMAKKNVRDAEVEDKVSIRSGYFEDKRLSDATIVYYGLTEGDDTLDVFEGKLREGCKLVTLSQPLIGVIPAGVDYPFYLSVVPFKRAKTIEEWVRSVLMKPGGYVELKEELRADPDYYADMRTLTRLVRKRFQA
jgi:SAM-dependent methyltransferase